MAKRRFIGLGRKRRPEKEKKKTLELPDNFIFGFTDQHRNLSGKKRKKGVNSEE